MSSLATRAASALLPFIFAAAPAMAHDFWIEPSAYSSMPGGAIAVHLRVGEGFKGDPVPRKSERIERFILVGPEGEVPIEGAEGADPAGYVRPGEPGLHVAAYRGRRSSIELEAGKFEAYLKEEGLDRIIALRAERGESGKPGREVYSRCAKSLIGVGDRPEGGFDRVVGLPLELVPEKDPFLLELGSNLPVRLFLDGKPLAGALIVAMDRGDPQRRIQARSDAEGRVRLRLDRDGVWLVKTVHMHPAPPDTGADWESLWASLTFEVR